MTIRRLLLMSLILVSIISIGINALILTSLTDRYFGDYLSDSYNHHVEQIKIYTESNLLNKELNYDQMAIDLETHLDDPLIRIKLYKPDGQLIVDVFDDNPSIPDNRMGDMMSRMMGNQGDEVERYDVVHNGELLGVLNVTRHSSIDNSFVAIQFKSALFKNSLYAIVIAILIAALVGMIISKLISKSLKDTAEYAREIQVGEASGIPYVAIREVNSIRESLQELSSRLRLRQKSRKTLIDEMVHQTRTPLTILKSHLEALEDGIIEMNQLEIGIWQNQIENITEIISNMSGMIDANKEISEMTVEEVELSQLLRQIIMGLKTQFDKKQIKLELASNEKIQLATDKYKLSQSIYNILTNAHKYTNSGGSVSISYLREGHQLIMQIQDTGIGMKKNDMDKVFEAYYRGESESNNKGEGIGLYIASENISAIGGTLSVKSQVGVGSTFIIQMPLNPDSI